MRLTDTPCDACDKAEARPISGSYRADCLDCTARMMSNGLAMNECERTGRLTPIYLSALQKVFGDRWQEAHKASKYWLQRRRQR